MAPLIYKRARAKRDLVEHFVYLAKQAGIETAERFLLSADKSFGDLSHRPRMGSPLCSPKLAGLRKWPVSEFESVLIFYLPCPGGVSIVRVMHAAQDWWRLLGIL